MTNLQKNEVQNKLPNWAIIPDFKGSAIENFLSWKLNFMKSLPNPPSEDQIYQFKIKVHRLLDQQKHELRNLKFLYEDGEVINKETLIEYFSPIIMIWTNMLMIGDKHLPTLDKENNKVHTSPP